MGKFDGVLLVTDFDDTFFPDSGVLPPANRRAVEYFKAQGGVFTVATGRAHTTFAPHLRQAGVNAPVILSNGAQLYDFDRDEVVLERKLPPTAPADFARVLELFPDLGFETYHGEDIYVCHPEKWTRHHIRKTGCVARECPMGDIPTPWSKAILHQEHELLLPAQRYIQEHWGERYEAIFSNFHMLELTAKGCTKGGMVLELAKRLGIDRQHLYCAGDNQNDIPMLAVAAIPFAPGDCAKQVKDWGAVLLPRCEEGAIAAAIEILDQKY